MNYLYFHHLAEFFCLPPINGLWFVLIGLFKWRSRKFILSCFLLAGMVIYIQYTPLFADKISGAIYPKLAQPAAAAKVIPEAIVVLGAGYAVEPDGVGNLKAFPAGYSLLNIESTAKVALENPRLPIVLSGGNDGDGAFSEAKAMSDYLKTKYSLINTQILEDKSNDTDENARFTAIRLKERKIDRVILVTQASHMWRSQALFARYGITTIPYPAWDYYCIDKLHWWQKVKADKAALEQTKKVLHEIIGYIVYVVF